MGIIYLSPSKLNLFRECPRCFHDAYTSDTPRPRGIMASLPGGMDLIMKKYVDQYRGKIPAGLEGKLPGVLFNDMAIMKRWRFWKTGPSWQDPVKGIILVGALDDCLIDGDIYIPLDWKTKGAEPKDDGSQYYQTQLDCYNLMLEYTGKQVRDEGWLVYIFPVFASIHCADDMAPRPIQPADKEWFDVTFEYKPFKLACSRERAKEIIYKAAECLRGPRPKPSDACEVCAFEERRKLLNINLN